MMAADPFGFSAARAKPAPRPSGAAQAAAQEIAARLAEIAPTPRPQSDPQTGALDRLAEEHGFPSREAGAGGEAILRRRRDVGPSAQLNIKCPVPVHNRFVRFCDAERLTYWEGVARLLDLAEGGRHRADRGSCD